MLYLNPLPPTPYNDVMFYHRQMPRLTFDQALLKPILDFGLSQLPDWKPGYDQNGLRWNVEELPLSLKTFPILEEISEGLQNEFKRPSFYLSRILPGGLVNHTDHRKWANLAIPLMGSFETTPLCFMDPFNHIVEKCIFQENKTSFVPVLINTRMTHSVIYPENLPNTPRIVLMMDLFDWPDHLFDKVDNNTIWKSTENFKYV